MLVNTSLCADLSEMMAAAAAAVASAVGVRSKVKVPAVVNCPDGDTVTVGGGRTCQPCLDSQTLLKSKFKCSHQRSDGNLDFQ